MRSSIAFVSACLLAAPGSGAELGAFGPETPVTLADLRPHLMDDEMYSEQWSHGVWTPDGYFVGVDFAISNLGLGDHKGGFRVEFKSPDGKKVDCKAELDDDEWSSARDGFHLTFGKQELRGDLTGLSVKVRCGRIHADLRFRNVGPPAKPGGGLLALEAGGKREGVYGMVFTSPRAEVSGQLVLDGKAIPIAGPGYCDHSWSDLAPYTLARRWFRFKLISEGLSVIMTELEAPRELGSAQRGWVLVYDGQGRVMATARTRFEYDGFITETKGAGYSIPRRVRLTAVDGQNSLTGSLLMTGVSEVRDPTAHLDGVRRAIVQRYSKPRDFSLECTYDLKLRRGGQLQELEGKGYYRYVFVNP